MTIGKVGVVTVLLMIAATVNCKTMAHHAQHQDPTLFQAIIGTSAILDSEAFKRVDDAVRRQYPIVKNARAASAKRQNIGTDTKWFILYEACVRKYRVEAIGNGRGMTKVLKFIPVGW